MAMLRYSFITLGFVSLLRYGLEYVLPKVKTCIPCISTEYIRVPQVHAILKAANLLPLDTVVLR